MSLRRTFGTAVYSRRVALPRQLIDPGAMLATTHELDDGSRVRLRLTRPTDVDKIRPFLEGLSADTRSRRFLAATPNLPST